MDWLEQFNRTLDYLEAHLDGEVDLERAGQLACCSTYQFQRIFSYVTGMTVNEYLRRRRMTAAAFDLQAGEKVLDVALRYGYESPTAFNRAFQTIHGVAPSAAQKGGVTLRSFPRIRLQLTIQGVTEMEYRIEKKEAFRIVGARTPISQDYETSFQQVPQFWMECAQKGVVPELCKLMDGSTPMGVLGLTTCRPEGEQNDYYIAVATNAPVPAGMAEEQIPAATWAIFRARGETPTAIQELQKRIVAEWLPTSGYDWAHAPDIEVYLGEPSGVVSDFEVWMPVTKKVD